MCLCGYDNESVYLDSDRIQLNLQYTIIYCAQTQNLLLISQAIISIILPKGEKGDPGVQGPPGSPGINGSPGLLKGGYLQIHFTCVLKNINFDPTQAIFQILNQILFWPQSNNLPTISPRLSYVPFQIDPLALCVV